jgi:hypothetical protein
MDRLSKRPDGRIERFYNGFGDARKPDVEDERFLRLNRMSASLRKKRGMRKAHLPNHEPQQLQRRIPRLRRRSIQDIMNQSRHEQRRVNPGNMHRRIPREQPQVVRSGRVPTNGDAEQRTDEGHGVDVVLPDTETAGAEVSCD